MYQYEMEVDDPLRSQYFDLTGSKLTVKASEISDEFTSAITFRAKNEYHREIFTTSTFIFMSCENFILHNPVNVDYTMVNSTISDDLTLDLFSETSKVIEWEPFTYVSISCAVDAYRVTCKDPLDRKIEVDGVGTISGDTTTSNCKDFVIETDPYIRKITIPSTITSFYEGEYQFEIIGYSLY